MKNHRRRSIRLPHYDYTRPGAYFVTLCTYQRELLFENVIEGTMQLDEIGRIVADEWLRPVQVRADIELEVWAVTLTLGCSQIQ